MGSWGIGILSDDTAADVHGEYMDKFNDGLEHAAIRAALEEEFVDSITDQDEGPVFWLAFALAQWECGVLEPDVLGRVTDLITSKQTLDRWEEGGAAQVRKRQQVLERFLEKISQPNQKPKRRRRVKHLPAVYASGDCLAIKLEDGDYGAALVLATDETPKAEGWNLVGVLRYKDKEKPPLPVFEGREWLHLTHHSWKGDKPEMHWCPARRHKKEGAALEVVGQVALREDDIREFNSFGGWNLGLQPVLQERWDQGERR